MNRALQFGEGLFETIKWESSRERLKLHYERLCNSAKFLSIPFPTYEEFLSSIKTAVGGGKDKYVKLMLLSRGEDYYGGEPEGFDLRVIVKELPPVPDSVELCISAHKKHSTNPLHAHKTLNYLFNILVKREATSRGFYDAVVLNEETHITECSASNILLLRGSKLFTPARESGLLWGTTVEWLSRRGADIREEKLNFRDIVRADSLFITNSIIGVVPVTRVEEVELPTDRDVLEWLLGLL